MINCNCRKWKEIIGDTFSENTDSFSSKGSSVPMWFGRVIYFCPWCGNNLKNFEDVYRCYVIKERDSMYFVGPSTDMWRVMLRELAERFTKEEALSYLENHTNTKFVIEDIK